MYNYTCHRKSSTAGSDPSRESIFSLSIKKQCTTESVIMSHMQRFPTSSSYRPSVLPCVKVGCNECLLLTLLRVHCQTMIFSLVNCDVFVPKENNSTSDLFLKSQTSHINFYLP